MKAQIIVLVSFLVTAGCSNAEESNPKTVVEDQAATVSHAKPEKPATGEAPKRGNGSGAAWWAEQNKRSSLHRYMEENSKKTSKGAE